MHLGSYRKHTGTRLKLRANDQGISLKRSGSSSGFLDRFLPRVLRRTAAPSVTLEGDMPSAVTLHEATTAAEAVEAGDASVGKQQNLLHPTFACHLCDYAADRITLLDRHLLDGHKISLDNLLKLVMAKIKNKDDIRNDHIGRPYYKLTKRNEQVDAALLFERLRDWERKEYRTVATNTEEAITSSGLKDSCDEITKQLEKLLSEPLEKYDQRDLMSKMTSLNDAMFRIVGSPGASGCWDAKATKKPSEFSLPKIEPFERFEQSDLMNKLASLSDAMRRITVRPNLEAAAANIQEEAGCSRRYSPGRTKNQSDGLDDIPMHKLF